MRKINIILIIYIIGIIFGALFLDIWGSDTNILKGIIAITWTAIFLIAYVYFEKKNEK
tara:strand:- start:352 stop:525 length:174 start_codon:yes stop_codon:yes gene_type:complete